MSTIPVSKDVLADSVTLLSPAEVADRLGVSIGRVHQMLRNNHLLAVRRGGTVGVPDIFFADRAVVKPLAGLITVMRDAGYTDEEILEWMFAEDDSLPGTPVAALHGPLAREVLRRAQANPV